MKSLEPQWDFTSDALGLISIEFLVNNITRRQMELMSAPGSRRDVDSQERVYRDRILGNLRNLLDLYRRGYVYSELIEAFWVACRHVGLLNDHGMTWMATSSPHAAVDELIRMLPGIVMSDECQRRAADRRYEAHVKRQGIERYTQAVLDVYSRPLVVRVDVGFRKDVQPYVTIDALYEAVDRFNAMRKQGHPLFDHLTGHLLNLEQGVDRGFHAHLGLIYNGSEILSDRYRGEMVGEAWATCTGGMGTVFNCNANKAEYERRNCCGLGVVDRNDAVKRAHVVTAMQYLSEPDKDDQYLRMKPEGRRTFWRGQLPKIEEHRRGRPPMSHGVMPGEDEQEF
ncbi:MAG: inovirus-type Gp2 protein [bacterium]|nr:inovirus-type Gp2 protein [bacterium]